MDGDIEDGDFGRESLGRDDVDLAREQALSFSRGDGQRLFLTSLKV